MALRIVVENAGTIETATFWQSTARLNASGSYSFSMPASDPAAAWLTPLARVFCYWDATLIAAGVVESLTTSGDMLDVTGGDLTRDLLYKTIRYTLSYNAELIANDLGAMVPAGWTYVDAITGATNIVALSVLWDSLQNAINTLCEMSGMWWHVVGTTLTIANAYGAVVANLTPVKIAKRVDASNMVGIVFPYGAGDGMAALTAKAANVPLTAPLAYFQETMAFTTAYGIARTDAPGYPATARRRRLDYKHIAPQTNTDAAIITAANTLVNAAANELRTNGTPITEYEVETVWAGIVRPLDRVTLTYNDAALKISETLVATEVTTRVTPESLITVGMRLEAQARRILSDDEVVADALIASRWSPVYPQLGVSDDTISETVRVDYNWKGQTDAEVSYSYPPYTTQVFIITSARTIAPITAADGGVNSGAGVPPALEYRLNGTGAWATFPATLDLTAALVNSTTLHQLANSFTLNVRGVLRTDYNATNGTGINFIPAIPVGTQVRLISRNQYFPDGMGSIYSNTLYQSVGGTVLNDIPLFGWVTITGTPVKSPTTGATRLYWYPATYRGIPGWVVLYWLNSSENVVEGPFATKDYSTDVVISLQLRIVSQAN